METLDRRNDSLDPPRRSGARAWALAMLWNRRAGEGLGEVAWLKGNHTHIVGRTGGSGERRVSWTRGEGESGFGIGGTYVSRRQLELTPLGPSAVGVRNVGRLGLKVNGHLVEKASLSEGDLLEVDGELLLLLQRREPLPARKGWAGPDRDGLVGEGPAIAALRARISAVGRASGHVLVTGPSGSGKERIAQGLHRVAGRGDLVSCNAAAIPEGVAEAEWFGNVRGYPNPGMPSRRGLAGRAHGGTLFIDELGELPHRVQAQLLRLLDTGEVQRLGSERAERVDLRVIAATLRGEAALKHDLAARFPHRIEAPTLDERPEDLGLLVRHLLDTPDLRQFTRDGVPRLTPRFWTALVQHTWTTHVRELLALLWESAQTARRDWLDRPSRWIDPPASPPPTPPPGELTAQAITDALTQTGGNKTQAAARLGLRSRHQLRRRMKKLGLS